MKGKKVLVGVTGGIAAYKAAELVRLLIKADLQVEVAMTESATWFITPLTLETLSGNRVITRMFGRDETPMDHIRCGQDAELIIIAPATANIIGKLAHGIGDDFLSTCMLAATAKTLVCPAMNDQMFQNPAVQDNLALLQKRGFFVMSPDSGELACGSDGPGRLPDPADILEQALALLSKQDLEGLKIMVTAGPTTEYIDPVRYITNRSSGKMGYAIALAALRRGAEVVLISGPTPLKPPSGLIFCPVKTAEEMRRAVFDHREGCHVIIKAAAVSDYRPKETAGHKVKKGAESLSLIMTQNPDILARLGQTKKDHPCVLVGFAAETQNLLENAQKKITAKNLDMIVANDVSRTDAGFGTDTNAVKIIYADGRVEDSPLLRKIEVAHLILDRAKALKDKTD
ncbi:MAG: bifunctional phosphopantothenoylcysteine decarboxylase/phosphopantothenate--cysteine ligase CoaBC [Deltaproteobacteria bacterium]|nr:bifunctional phosphopantothenoylcysteine decarboxylase/phosphopantothenate--cysteine ligase CoaBC [Deltaproteobacteria bacterium]